MESRLRENVEIVTIVDEDLMDLDQQGKSERKAGRFLIYLTLPRTKNHP